jgi:hypothetical protein
MQQEQSPFNSIAFTICSNNYLAQAKVLGDSFKKFHPDTRFIIGLVDTYSMDIDYGLFKEFEIIPVAAIGIQNIRELSDKYNIVELNTGVKPHYFSFLFSNYGAGKIIYLDPDIEVFSSFYEVFELLDQYNILLTPQNCVPIDDGDSPVDIDLLGTGIFNLGFIALSNYEKISFFLNWWNDRVLKYGYANPSYNMFYDQLWMNLVPVFFDNYYILKHPGYNMSPSNLHERKITGFNNGTPVVNGDHMLRFYHYSGFKHTKPSKICSYSNRYTFDERTDIRVFYENYLIRLTENKIETIGAVVPSYCLKASTLPPGQKDHFLGLLRRIKRALKVLIGKA